MLGHSPTCISLMTGQGFIQKFFLGGGGRFLFYALRGASRLAKTDINKKKKKKKKKKFNTKANICGGVLLLATICGV